MRKNGGILAAILLALAGALLIAADATTLPPFHLTPTEDTAVAAARAWNSAPFGPPNNAQLRVDQLLEQEPVHSPAARLTLELNHAALWRHGIDPDSLRGRPPTQGTVRERVEAMLRAADPRGALICEQDEWRVTITTREDADAGAAMRAARAAAPPDVRRALDAPTHGVWLLGPRPADALRAIADAHGLAVDVDWHQLRRTYGWDTNEARWPRTGNVGELIEHLFRRIARPMDHRPRGTPRYRVDGDRLVIVIPEAPPR